MCYSEASSNSLQKEGENRMKDTALVIMAAGIGSRFGGGIKQLEPVGPCGEIIMDYSIHDAIEAGFNKVVFIIRKDLEKDFKEIIGERIEKLIPVEYAYQELEDLPEGYELTPGRTKPWGTGQAVLAVKGLVDGPFLVINADDYYGREGFRRIHDYMVNRMDPQSEVYDICMGGFILSNTLSDNGTVTRGVCQVDENGFLSNVRETYNPNEGGWPSWGGRGGKSSAGRAVPAGFHEHVGTSGFLYRRAGSKISGISSSVEGRRCEIGVSPSKDH